MILQIGFEVSPTIREGKNLLRNWNPALLNTLKNICDSKTTKASDRAGNKINLVYDYSVSAYEFKQNVNLDYVKKAVYNSLIHSKVVDLGPNIQSCSRRTDAESMEYLKKNYLNSYNFIRSLEEGKNDLQDYID